MAETGDPFAGLSVVERKRLQEQIILECAYDLTEFESIEDRERPDFQISITNDGLPFGVEITQMFPNESDARLRMMPGYMESLWKGGRHRHKDDVEVLQVARDIVVTDSDGNVKHEGLTGIMVKPSTWVDLRTQLANVISHKSALNYDSEGLSHTNLVVLDWFHLKFNGARFSASTLIDGEVRDALVATQFREVYLLIYDTDFSDRGDCADGDTGQPRLKRVALKQLALLDVFGSVCHATRDRFENTGRGGELSFDFINRVACRISAEVLSGNVCICDGAEAVMFGANAAALRENGGFQLFDYGEHSVDPLVQPEAETGLSADDQQAILSNLENYSLTGWMSQDAYEPPSVSRLKGAE